MSYEVLADVYDTLMEDVDYQQWADYIDRMLKKNGCIGKKLLDLGCGTGDITIPLAEKGYQITAVDCSAEMLEIGRAKGIEKGLAIDWQQQDILQLQLLDENGENRVFDAIIATFDVINHVIIPEDLQMLLHLLQSFLADDGIVLFDVQTPYKLREYLGNHIFTLHREQLDYVWENHFDAESQICTMEITFFFRQENGLYQRKFVVQEERLYELELLQLWLKYTDFEVLGIYRELSEDVVEPEDHRAVFVAKPIVYADIDDEAESYQNVWADFANDMDEITIE